MNITQDPIISSKEVIFYKKKYAPRQLGIPILLRKMVKINPHKWAKHIDRNKHLYGECDSMKVEFEKDVQLSKECAKVISRRIPPKLSRNLASFRKWQLAPNRYNVKGQNVADIINKRTGTKGPFFSNTLRNDRSLYGHLQPPKPCGTYKFYNIPSSIDLLNRYYNKHKMKFATGSRYRKPYLRSMVTDKVLCWRDPSNPSPAHYFPKNHCLETNIIKPVKTKPITITNFLPNSSVPFKEMAYLKNFDKSIPSPGRYDPIEIACPCQKTKILESGIWQRIEEEKRKRFRHLKFQRIKEELYCPCSKVRNIRGHGYTSVFRSKTKRLIRRVSLPKKVDRLEKMHHTAKYIQMIVNPTRIPISFARIDLAPKPTGLTFNSVIKPKMRCKLKDNKRIAFLSASPRFKDEEKSPIAIVKTSKIEKLKIRSSILKKSKKVDRATLSASQLKQDDVYQRLQKLPPRFAQKHIALREKVFTFSPLPTPQLLVRESDIISRKSDAYFFNRKFKIEEFFKDEYKTSRQMSATSFNTEDTIKIKAL